MKHDVPTVFTFHLRLLRGTIPNATQIKFNESVGEYGKHWKFPIDENIFKYQLCKEELVKISVPFDSFRSSLFSFAKTASKSKYKSGAKLVKCIKCDREMRSDKIKQHQLGRLCRRDA